MQTSKGFGRKFATNRLNFFHPRSCHSQSYHSQTTYKVVGLYIFDDSSTMKFCSTINHTFVHLFYLFIILQSVLKYKVKARLKAKMKMIVAVNIHLFKLAVYTKVEDDWKCQMEWLFRESPFIYQTQCGVNLELIAKSNNFQFSISKRKLPYA